MKTVTQPFLDALAKPAINVKRQVYYKRRYWVAGSPGSYVWESSWTLLPETKIQSVSAVTSQLDTTTQNEFKVSNVTLVLKNFDSEWNPSNKIGYFGVDGISARGYEPFWTKFQIRAGLNLPPAANVVASEFMFQGNGSSAHTCLTAHTNVIAVTQVQVGGVFLTEGVDYTVSTLNDPNNAALVNMVVPPGAGQNAYVWYTYLSAVSPELVTLFTGVASDLNFNTTTHSVQITVNGLQDLLIRSNAENAGTTVTTESIGTGNSSTTIFTTAHNGVGLVKSVSIAGVVKRPGLDYTLSQLNDPSNPGKITFTVAPGTALALTATYVYWQQGKKVEELITTLLNLVPIAGGNQQVSTATYPNQITSTHLYSGQANWEAGTILNNVTEDGTPNMSVPIPYIPSLAAGSLVATVIVSGSGITLSAPFTGLQTGGTPGFGSPNNVNGSPIGVGEKFTVPVSGFITSITIGAWTQSVFGDTFAIKLYEMSGSNLNGIDYASGNYSNPTGPITISGLSIGIGPGTTYALMIIRTGGTGTIVKVKQNPFGSGNGIFTTTGTATSGLVDTSSGLAADLTCTIGFTNNAQSGTWQSTVYDTACISVPTSVSLTAAGSYPSEGGGYGHTDSLIYIDGSADGSTWDVTYTSGANLNGTQTWTVANRRYWRIRYALTATNTNLVPILGQPTLSFGNTGTWISAPLDMTSAPNSYGQLAIAETLNGGSDVYYTAVSNDNVTYDSYVLVPGSLIPQSALKRYIKIKVVQTLNVGQTASPSLASIIHTWYSSTVVVTLADFTGLTVYDAVTQLASIPNYEFGFDASENFFFRPKKASVSPVLSISDTDFIVDVLSLQGGYDQVYSGVRATYGNYIAEVDDTALLPTDPTPRFATVLYIPSVTSILISTDADIASNIAQALFNYYKAPRKKIKLSTKFLPQLDLSDIISVSFGDEQPAESWYYGDPDHYYGDPTIYYFGPDEIALPKVTTKVVGYRVDTDAWACELDLEEVI